MDTDGLMECEFSTSKLRVFGHEDMSSFQVSTGPDTGLNQKGYSMTTFQKGISLSKQNSTISLQAVFGESDFIKGFLRRAWTARRVDTKLSGLKPSYILPLPFTQPAYLFFSLLAPLT